MASNLARVRRDPEYAKAGRWVPFVGDIELRIASSVNPDFENEQREALRPHLEKLRSGEFTLRDQARAYSEAMARHLLTGWRGVVDESGNEIDCTLEARLAELTHPDADELRLFVIGVASNAADYRIASREEASKN